VQLVKAWSAFSAILGRERMQAGTEELDALEWVSRTISQKSHHIVRSVNLLDGALTARP